MTIFTALMDIDSINNIKEKFPFNASIKWVNILPIEFKGKYKFKYICLLFIYFYYSLNDNKKLT